MESERLIATINCGSFPFDYCYSESPVVSIFHSLLFLKRRQHEGAIAFLTRRRIGKKKSTVALGSTHG